MKPEVTVSIDRTGFRAKALIVTDPARRPKVLAIAEAANPEWVSVPLVGWSLAAALRDVADVHLVTQVRNREAILRAGWQEGSDFTVIDSEAVAKPMWKIANFLRMGKGKGWTTTTAIAAVSYPYFEHLVWKRFGSDLRAGRYDLVHRITPLSPTTNSLLARRCVKIGVPFVMGPLNGGVPWPKGFDSERRREREWLSYVRGAYKVLPGRKATLTHASAIITGSKHTQSEIPKQHQDKCFYLPENAIDPARFNNVAAQPGTLPLRCCFVGRLVPYKGPDMLLDAAAALLADGRLTLDILGDGPMLSELKEQASKLGVSDNVTFHGWVAHEEVQDIVGQCDLFTFPSIREFGGGVVLEAMALGVVPVVIDYAGPGELVVPGTGYKVALGTRTEIVQRLGKQLTDIAAAPENLNEIASNAKHYATTYFSWHAKACQVAQVYNWVLGNTENKPALLLEAKRTVTAS